FLNMAVMTSSVPFTGITLPFFSYGGSSLITTLASCGVLLSISTYSTTTVPTARNAVGWWRRSVAAMRQTA
ncbi:MAG: putative lipid II flippase FtsW, partial [Proteobacteria bacterium]|nr:putative lipid II flippase FtsW [Pseudomonadota bacterium]